MLVNLPSVPVLALSLDGWEPFLDDLWGHMQHKEWWVTTAYWGAIWTCGFVATFVLLRVFFTRWGDRDVMKKTLGVSLLLHLLFGMLSTNVVFRPGFSSEGILGLFRQDPTPQSPTEEDVRIGGVAIADAAADEDDHPGDENQIAEGGGRVPGRVPLWERPATFDRQISRLEQQPRVSAESGITPPPRAGGAEPLAFPMTAPADRSERADPFPEADRRSTKLKRPAEAPLSHINEETAETRPEFNDRPAGPSRAPRGAPGEVSAADLPRRTRPSKASSLPPMIDYGPDLAESAKASDPRPALARGSDPREPVPMVRGKPTSGPATVGPGDDLDTPAASSPGTSAGRPMARIGRALRNPAESGTLDRPRSGMSGSGGSGKPGGTGNGASGADGSADGFVAARSSTGVPDGEGLVPSIVRSEIEGAIGKHGGKVPAPLRLRTSPAREKFAYDMGATKESERAIEVSLLWLANHQHQRGYWEPIESTLGREPDPNIKFSNPQERERSGFNAHTGLTALAVLAFLGKGYTHEDNLFSDSVERALRWLIAQQDSQGFLGGQANPYARMYCHGMATIALGEAYGLTRDPALREPLVRAVQYIVDSQGADGGWRYFKGKQGDMSMFGWQLMALKSAKMAGLAIPQSAMNRAIDYLISHGDDLKNRRLSQYGGLAAYRTDERPKPSMTAESLFCKQMLGIKRTNRASAEAIDYLLKSLPQHSKQDLYYWYYGTLAMYQRGGDPWVRWNQALRDTLVADQRTDGDFAGSWNPRFPWGDYGGRVFSTALSTLCLEVYYRFLPEDAERLEPAAGN